jgi:hypothetical protein
MSEQLTDMLIVLEDAAILREERLEGDPNREVDETTEDDVILAMLLHQHTPLEILHEKNRWTRAFRLMIKGRIDPKG